MFKIYLHVLHADMQTNCKVAICIYIKKKNIDFKIGEKCIGHKRITIEIAVSQQFGTYMAIFLCSVWKYGESLRWLYTWLALSRFGFDNKGFVPSMQFTLNRFFSGRHLKSATGLYTVRSHAWKPSLHDKHNSTILLYYIYVQVVVAKTDGHDDGDDYTGILSCIGESGAKTDYLTKIRQRNSIKNERIIRKTGK